MPKRFAVWFFAVLSLLVMAYVGVAAFVNPRLDFSGRGVVPPLVRDARQQKMELFEQFSAQGPVDGLVLGSSRAMSVAPAELESLLGKRAFNFSVDSARAEDYLAIFNWTRSKGARLRFLLIGLDVEALHDNDRLDLRLRDNPALMHELEKEQRGLIEDLEVTVRRISTVFTMPYVYDIVRAVRVAMQPPSQPLAPATTFDADGVIRYAAVDQSPEAFDGRIRGSRGEYLGRFLDMTTLSEKRRRDLESVLQQASDAGITVALWITPLHHTVADYLAQQADYSRLLNETRVYVEGLRQRYDILIFDFSEPAFFDAVASGWHDGAHLDEANTSLLTSRIAHELRKHGL